MFTVGIDVGTSGAKAMVVGAHGDVRGWAACAYDLTAQGPGIAEHDPEVYWNAVCEVVPRALRQANVAAADVRAVGVSALSPVCILVDEAGHPLANAHIWMDRRGVRQADWIRERVGQQRVFDVSGNVIDPFFGTVKWLWEQQERPELCQRARHVFSAVSFLTHRLTGKATLDQTSACLFGIAYNIHSLAWDHEMLERLGLRPSMLPDVVSPDTVVGGLLPRAAQACGLAPDTPVIAGLVDGSAVCAGTGMTQPGDSVIFLGSSACLFVVQDHDTFAMGPINMVHPLAARLEGPRHTAVGALVSGGTMLRYLRDVLGEHEQHLALADNADAYDLLTQQAATVPPGCEGLTLLPYLMGERTPIWDTHATGAALGFRPHHGKGHWIRAGMESVAFGLRHNLDALRGAGVTPQPPVRIAEGGARCSLWREIVADTLELPLRYLGETGGAPLGAALLAGVATGTFDMDVFRRLRETPGAETHPQQENAEAYRRGFKTYRALYEALRPLYDASQE